MFAAMFCGCPILYTLQLKTFRFLSDVSTVAAINFTNSATTAMSETFRRAVIWHPFSASCRIWCLLPPATNKIAGFAVSSLVDTRPALA